MAQGGEKCKNTETLAYSGGSKKRKSIFIDPQRPHFPRKKLAFCSSVPGLDANFENPIKYVPLGAQKAADSNRTPIVFLAEPILGSFWEAFWRLCWISFWVIFWTSFLEAFRHPVLFKLRPLGAK